jgi:signal transduction histidine kinase
VGSLRNFSRLDEAQCKQVDIHEGIENTLFILQHRLKSQPRRSEIQILREYGQLPRIECYPGELNQVFMNIICNTIDALDEFAINAHLSAVSEKSNKNEQITTEFRPMIRICTNVANDSRVVIRIADNGGGIRAEVVPKIFDPFFTTKPPGKGTGLGLFICYQIVVDKHGGELTCHSVPGQGTELLIELPIVQAKKLDSYLEKSSQIASLLGTGDKL